MYSRVTVLIDGFNLYHALKDTGIPSYKWIDLKNLACCYLGAHDRLESIFYFTALATWSAQKVKKTPSIYSSSRIQWCSSGVG